MKILFLLSLCLFIYANEINNLNNPYKPTKEDKNHFDDLWLDVSIKDEKEPFGRYKTIRGGSSQKATSEAMLLNTPILIDSYKDEERKRIENLPKEFKPLNITTDK